MKRLLLPLTVVALVGLLLSSATPAAACIPIPTTKAHFRKLIEEADIVAIATVVRMSTPTGNMISAYELAEVKVHRYWKGSGASNLNIVDQLAGSDCSLFSEGVTGRTLVFFVTADDELYETNRNAGTDVVSPGDFEAIAELRVPSDTSFPILPAAIAATLGPLAFLAAAAFVWGQRRET